jgi:hypothetical protein
MGTNCLLCFKIRLMRFIRSASLGCDVLLGMADIYFLLLLQGSKFCCCSCFAAAAVNRILSDLLSPPDTFSTTGHALSTPSATMDSLCGSPSSVFLNPLCIPAHCLGSAFLVVATQAPCMSGGAKLVTIDKVPVPCLMSSRPPRSFLCMSRSPRLQTFVMNFSSAFYTLSCTAVREW